MDQLWLQSYAGHTGEIHLLWVFSKVLKLLFTCRGLTENSERTVHLRVNCALDYLVLPNLVAVSVISSDLAPQRYRSIGVDFPFRSSVYVVYILLVGGAGLWK